MDGRNAKGQFIKGHQVSKGKGRPKRSVEDKYLKTFSATVKKQDLKDIILGVMSRAKAQDMAAARLILEYALGKPQQQVDVTSGGERLPSVIVYLPEIDGLEAEPGTTGEVSS